MEYSCANSKSYFFLPFLPIIKDSLQKFWEFSWNFTAKHYNSHLYNLNWLFRILMLHCQVFLIQIPHIFYKLFLLLSKQECWEDSWMLPLRRCLPKSSKPCFLLHIFRLPFIHIFTCRMTHLKIFGLVYISKNIMICLTNLQGS